MASTDSIKAYWRTWLWRDAVTRIITINCVVWLILGIAHLLLPGTAYPMLWSLLVLPGTHALPLRAWTLLTYMFTQTDFMHLLCNMLWFMLFGNLLMQTQNGGRVAVLYIYGGVVGGLSFMLFNASYPMLGASCAVMAIIGATMLLTPGWHVNLLIFGPVKVLWLCIAAIVFFIVLSPSPIQAVAHAMGLLVGVAYALLRKRGIDITSPFTGFFGRLAGVRPATARPLAAGKDGFTGREEQEFEALLAKVSRSGYASLTSRERQRLFDLSQKIKR